MVRVISIHHFTNQVIQTVEQPNAVVIAPPNRLLLALPSHCIEVRDLNFNCDVLFSFPTVNEVLQLLHCLNGTPGLINFYFTFLFTYIYFYFFQKVIT